MNKVEFAKRLRIHNHWLVDDSNFLIKANLTYGGKVISLEFSPTESGLFRVSFPRYAYASKVSHYASFDPELRQCQNKALLFHVVGHLKRVGAWDVIDNKNFFRVNVENKSFSYKEASRNMRLRMDKGVRMYKAAKKVQELPADLPPPTIHGKKALPPQFPKELHIETKGKKPSKKASKPSKKVISSSLPAKKDVKSAPKKPSRALRVESIGTNDFFG